MRGTATDKPNANCLMDELPCWCARANVAPGAGVAFSPSRRIKDCPPLRSSAEQPSAVGLAASGRGELARFRDARRASRPARCCRAFRHLTHDFLVEASLVWLVIVGLTPE